MPRPARPKVTFARVRLLVSDFRRSWRFYHEVLGLEPVTGHGEPPYGEFRAASGAMVSLFDRKLMASAVGLKPGRYRPEAIGRSLLTFETDDVDRFAAMLRRRRVPIVAGLADRPVWGERTVHFRDPDGYLIEVYSPRPSG